MEETCAIVTPQGDAFIIIFLLVIRNSAFNPKVFGSAFFKKRRKVESLRPRFVFRTKNIFHKEKAGFPAKIQPFL